ncbi:hypothetical protein NMK71_07975 [Weeksellaceae bacterium KMM 9713]|uniref:Uncharacterized protein n=1 Tax=Profundicola chukchiensis TaxID=2961959 RepID=A0A9X4RUQ1_9FLAO|nr:hypothetical protein [Profundicola chukchiensis]MDG4946348.1 hypothetical protein [Profundicola chukchiensis]
MRLLLLLSAFLITSCSLQTSPLLSQNINSFENQEYQLTGNENPLKVRVTAVLLQRADGSGNYSKSRPNEFGIFQTYWQNALNNFQDLKKPSDLEGCYDGLDFWPKAMLVFEDKIIEVKNTYAWNHRNTGSIYEKNILKGFSPNERWYMKSVDDSLTLAEKDQPSIHVYFTNDGDTYDEYMRTNGANQIKNHGIAAGQFPTPSNLKRSSQIHYPGVYPKYFYMKNRAPQEFGKSWDKEIKDWYLIGDPKGLTHELGHNFGLGHANKYHGANKCKWTIMSQKHSDPRNYLQPTEIQKMHSNLSKTNMMQFVTEDSHYGTTQVLNKDQTWTELRRYYNDFVLQNGLRLRIANKIIMPTNAKITLNPGARIIFEEGGEIVYLDGTEFNGYELKADAKIIR